MWFHSTALDFIQPWRTTVRLVHRNTGEGTEPPWALVGSRRASTGGPVTAHYQLMDNAYQQHNGGLAPAPMPTSQQANQILAQQDHYIREQDAALGTVSDQLAVLRNMGRRIGGELGDQNKLLDELEAGVDANANQMQRAQARLQRLARISKKNWYFCTIMILVVVLALVLYFVLTT